MSNTVNKYFSILLMQKIHLRLEMILVFQRFTKEAVSNISRIIHYKQSNVTDNLTVL